MLIVRFAGGMHIVEVPLCQGLSLNWAFKKIKSVLFTCILTVNLNL